jgi:ABC-2 type transport system permease protein
MKRWGPEMRRAFSIWLCFFKNVLAETMAYRINFFLMTGIHVGWFAVYLGTYGIIFRQVKSLAGWLPWEVVFLAGTWQLIFTIFVGLFVPNLSNISWFIKTGEMDFVLAKPISPLFYLSINRVELGGLFSCFASVPAILFALKHLPQAVLSPGRVAAYVLLLAAGVVLLYSLMLCIVSIAFWATRASSVQGLFWAIQEFGGYPAAIYTRPVRWVLTFIIPVAVIANMPAAVLIRGLSPWWVLSSLGIAAGAFLVSRFVFYQGLKRYQSASS